MATTEKPPFTASTRSYVNVDCGGMDGCLCFVRSSNGFLVLTEVLGGTTHACVHENTVNYNSMTSLVVVVLFSTKLRLQNRGDCLAVSLVNAK